ncbi:MAG TPA: GIY-YIG nuclease family protein [Candidatus Paceibacterota bacterium]
MFFVYMLECSDKSLYTGSTNDLGKRLKQHNTSKQGAHYTKIRRPVRLVYQEKFRLFSKARAREGELKRLSREQKLKLLKKLSI